jgi:3-oxoacyl-[acyl-carrier-protein] synthase-3
VLIQGYREGDTDMKMAKIIGTGSWLPEKVLTNRDLEAMVDTSDEWIVTRTGIKERRVTADGETSSSMAVKAASRAIAMAGLSPQDMDLIIVGTVTPDMLFPSCACMVQDELGASGAAAFDVSAGWGFLYGLSVADKFIKSGSCRTILVIGVDNLSKITNYEDRKTCVLLGDGAGAVVLTENSGDRGILSTHLFSNGSYKDLLFQPAGGSALPASHETVNGRLHTLHMDGNRLFKLAVKALEDAVVSALASNGIQSHEIDMLIPHQANIRIIQAITKRLDLPEDKVVLNIEKYGNTSSASIPIALDEANRDGRIEPGNLLLFNAFGAGLTWGAALVRW